MLGKRGSSAEAGSPPAGACRVKSTAARNRNPRITSALLAGSAVAGLACAAAQPAAAQDLTPSAFQRFFALGGDSKGDVSDRGFGFSTDTEVQANEDLRADKGITFGFQGGFEADSGAVGNPTPTFLGSAFSGDARPSNELRIGNREATDATKLTYVTPSFAGFSAGLSYTPDTSDGNDGNDLNGADGTGHHDNLSLALGYDGEYNSVGFSAAVVGAYARADAEPEDEAYGIGGGLSLEYSGFTVAAGAVWDDLNGNGGEGWATDLGLAYGSGPWFFSLNGIYSKDDDSGDGLLGSSANVRYNLATGVSVFAVGYLGEEDLGASETNDIMAISSGIRLSF